MIYNGKQYAIVWAKQKVEKPGTRISVCGKCALSGDAKACEKSDPCFNAKEMRTGYFVKV